MTRRRRTRPGPPRCRHCDVEVRFFRDQAGRWRVFNPKPVDGRTTPTGAVPMWSDRVWDVNDLTAELTVQRGSAETAAEEVLDLPWFTKHQCEIRAAITNREETAL